MDKHLKQFNKYLKGKTIKEVTWLSEKDMENMMCTRDPL